MTVKTNNEKEEEEEKKSQQKRNRKRTIELYIWETSAPRLCRALLVIIAIIIITMIRIERGTLWALLCFIYETLLE